MTVEYPIVFPIISYEPDDKVFRSHGSAFFVNENGVFVTAAHTFKHPTRIYFAVINKVKYPVTIIWQEYKDLEKQVPPHYADLLIGKVEHLLKCNFAVLDNNDPSLSACTIMGYNFNHYGYTNPSITLDELWDNFDEYEESEENPLSEDDKKISNLKFDAIPGMIRSLGFVHISIYETGFFTNGFTLSTEVNNLGGYSGGCVLIGKKVYGMFIAENAAITSRYILSKLVEKADFTPYKLPSNNLGVLYDQKEDGWLSKIVTNTNEVLRDEDLYSRLQPRFLFALWSDLPTFTNDDFTQFPSLKNSFSFTKSNFENKDGEHYHLVVVNKELCEKAKLDTDELIAVLIHEIGHSLNKPSNDSNSTGQVNDQHIKNELYADNLAHKHNHQQAIIKGLNKYTAIQQSQDMEMILKRIEVLKAPYKQMHGYVIELTT